MSDLNRVSLIGKLVKNAELRYTANGKSVSSFSIAVNGYKNQNGEQEVSFFDIVLWNSETRHQYLKKGVKVAIDGVLKQERWKDNNGSKARVVVVVWNLYLLSKKETGLPEVQDTSYEKVDESIDSFETGELNSELDDIPF